MVHSRVAIVNTNMKFLAILLVCTTYVVADPEIVPIPGGLNGTGTTTRYWDCCKPSCSWVENINGTSATTPVRSCAADGATTIGVHEMSGCAENGTSYMCTDQEPLVVNDTLTLGFVAASFKGGADVTKCCSCMLLSFKSPLAGKQMAVQITNTGSDLGANHFDIAMPGGGVGLFNGCSTQWGAPTDGWGARYGGVSTVEECDNLPEQLRSGCRWRFQWFQGADNPAVEFYEIECPKELIAISQCQ